MKIKIPEELIKEFIGTDLEPIEGNTNPIQSTFTAVNYIDPDEEDNIPQTTDKFIQHARRPWWWSNVYGGYGFTSVGTVSENKNSEITEAQVKEDIITKDNKLNGEIIKDEKIPSLDDLENIYDNPLIKKQVLEFTEMLQKMGGNIQEEDEGGVLAIILNYLLNNINTASIPDNFKKKLKNAIK